MVMPFDQRSSDRRYEPGDAYLQDDILRGLRASLVAVLATALTQSEQNYDFLKGALSLARSQAALYGIPWSELIESLCDVPELCLIPKLQDGQAFDRT